MPAHSFLTDAEQQTLIRTVKDVESRTSGEIVPVIVSQSFDYPRASAFGALVMGVGAALPVCLIAGYNDMWSFLALFLAGYALSWLLCLHIPQLRRAFVTKAEMKEEVEEAAITNFFLNGLHRTRDLTGIIIFVSVFEHRVHVLADKGINDKVDPAVWQGVADMVTEGIKNDRAGEALCDAVKRCGELITEHFPIKHDDTDELPNLIIGGEEKK